MLTAPIRLCRYDANNGGVHIIEKHPQAFTVVLAYYVIYAAAVAVIITILTRQGQQQVYLSPYPSDSTQRCNEVTKALTGTYQGDALGNWETAASFSQPDSIFVLSFQGTKVTTESYKRTMQSFKKQLAVLGDRSARRDQGWGINAWASFSFYDPATKISFYASADAGIIFNGVCQVCGVCPGPAI